MKLVLITGGTSGIGFALVEQYLQRGYRVIFTGRNKAKVAEKVTYFSKYRNFILGQVIDVRDTLSMHNFIHHVSKNYGLDIVIANAGISTNVIKEAPLAEMAKIIFDTNVYGVFNTIHPSLEVMMQKGEGQIAIVSSLSSYFGLQTSPYYAASKAAVRILAEGMAPLLQQHHITLSTIIPGFVETNITKNSSFKKQPLLITAKKASNIIFHGLQKHQKSIIFPKRLFILIYFLMLLPRGLRELCINKLLAQGLKNKS